MSFLRRVQADQDELNAYCSAPLGGLVSALRREAGETLLDAIQTCLFNWAPLMSSMNPEHHDEFRIVQLEARVGNGLAVNAGLVGPELSTFMIHFIANARRLRSGGLREMVEELGKVVRWLLVRENSDLPIKNFVL